MAKTEFNQASGSIQTEAVKFVAPDFVLLKRRQRKETLREVYVKGREALIKRYLVDKNARFYPKPWRIEDRALRRLEGLPVPRSHGFTETIDDGRREAIFTREFIEGSCISKADSANIPLMASLVAGIHSRGVITRDLDVGNFLIGRGNRMYFLDFGKALVFDRAGPLACWWMGSDLARFMKNVLDYDRERWGIFWRAYAADHRLSRVNRAIVRVGFLFSIINRSVRNTAFHRKELSRG